MSNNIKDKVSLEDKKEFLRWILKNEKIPMKEMRTIISYLRDSSLLKNISFVDRYEGVSPLLIASTRSSEENLKWFSLIEDKECYNDPELILQHISMNQERVYVYVAFKNKYQNDKFLKVLEEYKTEDDLSPEILEEANSIISKMEKGNILKMIDKALDQKDEKMFMELWGIYLEMENK